MRIGNFLCSLLASITLFVGDLFPLFLSFFGSFIGAVIISSPEVDEEEVANLMSVGFLCLAVCVIVIVTFIFSIITYATKKKASLKRYTIFMAVTSGLLVFSSILEFPVQIWLTDFFKGDLIFPMMTFPIFGLVLSIASVILTIINGIVRKNKAPKVDS